MEEPTLLAAFFMWAINIFYLSAILPQLLLNYKLKTASGLSDLFILGYFNAYVAFIFYVFYFRFPCAYLVMVPVSLFAVGVLVFQRFYYDISLSFWSLRFYLFNMVIIIATLLFFLRYPNTVAHFCGWFSMVIWTVSPLPQAYKIYKAKSVKGFSFLLVTLVSFGNLVELLFAIMYHWPIQSLLIAFRGLLLYPLFCFQFWTYSK